MVRLTYSTVIVILLIVVVVQNYPLHHSPTLKDACANIDRYQGPEEHREMRKKCAAEIYGKNDNDPVKKCFTIMNLEDKTFIKKACQNPEEHEKKFQEVKACLDQNRPEPGMRKQFHECIHKASTNSPSAQ